MPSFKPVVALTRGLEVLRVVNAKRQATVRSLHQETGIDKATIVRMLETLVAEGYVMRDAERAIYAPTGRTLQLSQGYDQHLWIGSVAEPILQEIRKQIEWPVDIALFDRDAMVISRTVQERGSMFVIQDRPGFRIPLMWTSLGLAYLAFCSEEERGKIIARLARKPDKWSEPARNPKRLEKMLATVRQNGYAVTSEEYSKEFFDNKVWGIGVPVRNGSQVFAALNIMMLKSAVSQEQGVRQYLRPLQETAARIAASLTEKTAVRDAAAD